MNQQFLTTKDIADKLGFSTSAVTLWIKDGRLKAFKFGKDYRITQADFDEFLSNSQVNIVNIEE